VVLLHDIRTLLHDLSKKQAFCGGSSLSQGKKSFERSKITLKTRSSITKTQTFHERRSLQREQTP
jgi:hypothetical protein